MAFHLAIFMCLCSVPGGSQETIWVDTQVARQLSERLAACSFRRSARGRFGFREAGLPITCPLRFYSILCGLSRLCPRPRDTVKLCWKMLERCVCVCGFMLPDDSRGNSGCLVGLVVGLLFYPLKVSHF